MTERWISVVEGREEMAGSQRERVVLGEGSVWHGVKGRFPGQT